MGITQWTDQEAELRNTKPTISEDFKKFIAIYEGKFWTDYKENEGFTNYFSLPKQKIS
jgi:hypothetical protein